jgi:hypothetical protein
MGPKVSLDSVEKTLALPGIEPGSSNQQPAIILASRYCYCLLLLLLLLLLRLYGSLFGLGHFFNLLIRHTVHRSPWKGDQPIAKPLHRHRTTHTHTQNKHRHPCLEWGSNPQPQCLNRATWPL